MKNETIKNNEIIKNIEDVKNIYYNFNGEIMTNELETIYDTRKSFYNKAITKKIITNDFIIDMLFSYDTLVCSIVSINDKKYYILNNEISYNYLFSNTTLRHIKEFLLQNINILRLSHIIDGKITKNDIIKSEKKEF